MQWLARVIAHGALTQEDSVAIGTAGCEDVTFTSVPGPLELRYRFTADTAAAALAKASAILDEMVAFDRLLDAGTVEQPTQITVTSEEHPDVAIPLLSTSAVASRLGVSAARVRELKSRVDFPLPVKVHGVPGDVYDAADIDRYAAARARTRPLGRPRQGDEQLMTEALSLVQEHGQVPIDIMEHLMVERAIHAPGGRNVADKARLLLDYTDKHQHELGPIGQHPRVVQAIQRAREMWAE